MENNEINETANSKQTIPQSGQLYAEAGQIIPRKTSYLTQNHGGNLHDKKIVGITSRSAWGNDSGNSGDVREFGGYHGIRDLFPNWLFVRELMG
jgi:hypothetical protein